MQKIFLILFGILLLNNGYTQKTAELGGFAGASIYYGDLNERNLIHTPSYAFGGFYQQNFSPRYSGKIEFAYANLTETGYDALNINRTFNNSIVDIGTQFIINFLPFDFNTLKKDNFSTYISTGASVHFNLSLNNSPFSFALPIEFGAKWMVSEKITVGVKHSMRKLFHDHLDDFPNNEAFIDNTLIHNNDWCSFTGIFISCRVFQQKLKCSVYQ